MRWVSKYSAMYSARKVTSIETVSNIHCFTFWPLQIIWPWAARLYMDTILAFKARQFLNTSLLFMPKPVRIRRWHTAA